MSMATESRSIPEDPPSLHNDHSSVAHHARSLNLFSTTPLILSSPLSRLCSPHRVYLKLDLLQPSGSFKDRGMAHLCTTVQKAYESNRLQVEGKTLASLKLKLISSSGGNAGLAVATVASNIPGMDVSVVVPKTTKPLVIEKLKTLGADVTVFGKVWNEADGLARQWVAESQDGTEGKSAAVYVSPYDNPLLWTGHSTVVDEVVTQILDLERCESNTKIGAILASVGGGGLLAGIFEGIERNYYSDNNLRSKAVRGIKVVACETEGAASFAASFNASRLNDENAAGKNDVNIIRLDGINSVATSLGALEVTSAVIHRSFRHQERGRDSGDGDDVLSVVCTDAEAVDACVRFSDDHRMLVEPACGAALAPLYSDRLRAKLLEKIDSDVELIVVEICGGNGVNIELLDAWKREFL